MKWLFYGLMIVGGMFARAWYGAKLPNQTLAQKRTYGLLALATWTTSLILANTLL